MEKISSGLKEILERLEMESLLIWKAWQQLDVRGVKRSRPASFNRGCLIVEVASSTVAQELSYNKQRIIQNINSFLGKDLVKEIRFRTTYCGSNFSNEEQ
jgi:predicted nucleic acid-binding Zn ribbon protein